MDHLQRRDLQLQRTASRAQGKGHQFRTNSDTEVIIHGYKEWGTDVFNHLNGMFGLAIWDVRNERLVVARDAMGIKLVYYKIDNGQLPSDRKFARFSRRENCSRKSIPSRSICFSGFAIRRRRSRYFKVFESSRPGRCWLWRKANAGKNAGIISFPTPFATPKKDEEAVAELLDLYKGAVKRHLLSDVPVGILLSGGLDSGLLLALNERTRRPVAGIHDRLWRELSPMTS